MTRFIDENRIWLMIGGLMLLTFGGIVVWQGQSQIATLDAQVADASEKQMKYTILITQRNVLRKEYAELVKEYVGPKREVAYLEAEFMDDLSRISKRHGVTFVGAAFGEVNGSNPPAPNPYVNRNGQTIDLGQQGANGNGPPGQQQRVTVTDLGGNPAGDPKIGRPNIPSSLFNRVPVALTMKGGWRDLNDTLQDMTRQDVLMSVSDPEVRRFDASTLTLSFTAQILVPAVTISPGDLGPQRRRKAAPAGGTRGKAPRMLHGPHPLPSIDHRSARRTDS